MLPSRTLKGMLWSVWVPIQGNATPNLRAALQSKAVESSEAIGAGSVVKSTSNGHVTEMASFGNGQFTAAEIGDGWVYLVDLFDTSAAELGGTPTDVQVEVQMELNLRPILNASDNWMYLSK